MRRVLTVLGIVVAAGFFVAAGFVAAGFVAAVFVAMQTRSAGSEADSLDAYNRWSPQYSS